MKNRPDFHPAPTKIVQLMGLEPVILSPINTVNTTIPDFTGKIRDKLFYPALFYIKEPSSSI